MKVVNLEISKISPNSYNPNLVPKDIFSQLKKSIKKFGIEQPILVREVGDKYVIIDGEHRYKIALEFGFKTVPVVIRDITESEAKIQTINMNRLHGEFNKVKLAGVLKGLQEDYSQEELTALTGFSEEDLDTFNSFLDLPDVLVEDKKIADQISDEMNTPQEPITTGVSFDLTLPQLDILEVAMELAGKGTKEKSIIEICSEYIKFKN